MQVYVFANQAVLPRASLDLDDVEMEQSQLSALLLVGDFVILLHMDSFANDDIIATF